MLRPYQQQAHDEIVKWVKRSTLPCMIEAATGAGKSHIIASLAETVRAMSGKHVLVLAPSKELVEQNHAKFPGKASIYSASAGRKSLEHPVVFGTPMTVLNSIKRFGEEVGMVVIDECHGITLTVKEILRRIPNPNLRVVGLSATPYRMGTGYIFENWPNGAPAGEEGAFFSRCVYRITAPELISMGFLTPPVIGEIGADPYQTQGMLLDRTGKFFSEDVDKAYHGQGRKTSKIVEDIVARSADRRGVLIFAATVRHANEVLASLPPEISAIVTGETLKKDREAILVAFKEQKIKYIVNVAVLTTGFDATHVDVIAMMRATESVGLMQQIIGRGLRLHEGKQDCLILDYAENVERHCPDGDVFSPTIENKRAKAEGEIECTCPFCDIKNVFTARPNPDGYEVNKRGYFCDLDGVEIEGEHGPIPAHFGRRCRARDERDNQCNYRWTSKDCPECDAENDISARYCYRCRFELVDPNEKLRVAFKEKKRDPYQTQRDVVLAWAVKPSVSRSGNQQYSIDVTTPYRHFRFWVMRNPKWQNQIADYNRLVALNGRPPKTITYRKDDQFFKVYAYNEAADESP